MSQIDKIELTDDRIDLDLALRAAKQVAERVRSLSANIDSSSDSLLFYSRTRVKSRSSILGKEIRKKKDGKLYNFRKMTDLVGYRIVTLYPTELKSAMDHVKSILLAGKSLREPLFMDGPLVHDFKEILFYGAESNSYYKECSEYVKKYLFEDGINWKKDNKSTTNPPLEEIDLLIERTVGTPENKADYYSSAHFIIYSISYIDSKRITIPIEVQVRTALEDIWSEVNHKQLYKLKSDTAWTYEYEKHYRQAISSSSDLKANISSGLEKITQFSEVSVSAIRARKELVSPRLKNNPNSLPSEATIIFDVSLVGYIIYILGHAHRDYFQRYYIDFANQIVGMRVSQFTSNDVLEKLDEARSALLEADEELSKLKASQELDSPESILIDERRRLLNLEQIRLKITALLWCGAFLEKEEFRVLEDPNSSDPNKTLSEESDELEDITDFAADIAREYYHELCIFMNENGSRVQPVTMIGYWKAIVASCFDRELAWEEIQKCYQRYRSGFDECLTDDSVYHCLLRAEYAEHALWRALDFLEPLDSDLLLQGKLPSKRDALYEQIRMAFVLAYEAYELSSGHEHGQGDLTFGFSSSLRFRCIDLCFSAIMAIDNHLGRLVTGDLLSSYDKQILRMVQDARNADDLQLSEHGIDYMQFHENCSIVIIICET